MLCPVPSQAAPAAQEGQIYQTRGRENDGIKAVTGLSAAVVSTHSLWAESVFFETDFLTPTGDLKTRTSNTNKVHTALSVRFSKTMNPVIPCSWWHKYSSNPQRLAQTCSNTLQDAALLQLSARYEGFDWDTIAKHMPTGRTAWTCFSRYQKSLNNAITKVPVTVHAVAMC